MLKIISGAFILSLIFTNSRAAEIAEAFKNYNIIFNKDGSLSARSKTENSPGKRLAQEGSYSQWEFNVAGDQMSAIVNDKLKTVIATTSREADGLVISNISPDNSYVILNIFECNDISNFKIFDARGNLILNDTYQCNGENTAPLWSNSHRITYLKDYPSNDNEAWRKSPEAAAKCEKIGSAVLGKWVSYDVKTKKLTQLKNPSEWICLQ